MDESHGTQRHVTITGGGTAGHVHPGLALAAVLTARGWSVSWLGRRGSVEEQLVTSSGLPFAAVPASPVIGRGILRRGRALATSLRGAVAARGALKRQPPRVVVGTGGYVSFPGVLAAWSRHVPVLLFESNAGMGLANRALSRFADRVAWGYPSATDDERTVTGVPVDASFFDDARRPASQEGTPLRILVLGGSQGAEQLNRAVPVALGRSAELGWSPVRVLHQCGRGHLQATRERYATVEADAEVTVVEFIDEVAEAMHEADVVVSRAGAQTLAELAAIGRAAILAPLGAAQGHQALNAQSLVDAGAAWSLAGLSEEALSDALAQRLASLHTDRGALRRAAESMAAQARPDAASRLADLVVEMARAD